MIRRTLTVGVDDLASADGAVLCRDLDLGRGTGGIIRRGTKVGPRLRQRLASYAGRRLEVVCPDVGEVSQEAASVAVARALAGPGVRLEAPHQGQVLARADIAGLARVEAAAVDRVNRTGAALVATSLDGRVVAAEDVVAVVKAPRLWIATQDLDRVHAAASAEVLRVAPFASRPALLLVGQRVRPASVPAAQASLDRTLRRYGSRLVETARVGDDRDQIATALTQGLASGVEIILVAGSIVLDPGDPFLVAVERLGGEVVCRGAPVDPGTMFWVANLPGCVAFGLASCEIFGRLSVLDLVLPYALAGERIDAELIARFGYGGLLDQTFAARRGSDAADELGVPHPTGDESEADEPDDDTEPERPEANEQSGRGGD